MFIVYPGLQSLDLAGPYEVFAAVNDLLAATGSPGLRYRLTVAAPHAGPLSSGSGLTIGVETALAEVRGPLDTVVVVGGAGMVAASTDAAVLHHVRRLARRSRRTASVCTGSFVLAAAGLLDGRVACTHWAFAGQFRRRFPHIELDGEALFRGDGTLWCSAGVTAGIDLALSFVEADHGAQVAQTVARWLVMFLRRPGGQSQFGAPLWHEASEVESIRVAQDAVAADPAGDHRIAAMAARACMSERNFVRVFTREVGTTPAKYVEAVRIEAACRTLEVSHDGVESVARACGFRSAETMRRAFLRRRGVSPSDYRQRFALVAS